MGHIRPRKIIDVDSYLPCLRKTPVFSHVRTKIVGAMLFENASIVGAPPELQAGTVSLRNRHKGDAISGEATMADTVSVEFSEAGKNLFHVVLKQKLDYRLHCLVLALTSALSCLNPSENIKTSLSVTELLCSKSIVNRGMVL